MRLRNRIILGVVGVLLCGAGYFVYSVHRYVTVIVPNCYAVEWVGSMVVDHLRQHQDHWPQSWEDLRPIYEQHTEGSGGPWKFEDLKARVNIRWDVDVEQVRRLQAPPKDLIVLSDGGSEHWDRYEPNEMVYRYLKGWEDR